MIGFVDESLRQGLQGLYVVSLVVLGDDVDHARTAARSVVRRRQPRFHWRAEAEPLRLRMLSTLVEVAGAISAYACRPVAPGKQERARALCLTRLLWDLRALGVDRLVLESRQAHNDRKDRRVIAGTMRAGGAPAGLAYEFGRPHEDPALWFADAVAGAVAAGCGDGATGYADMLGDRLTVVELNP